jgi:hypothetical protein
LKKVIFVVLVLSTIHFWGWIRIPAYLNDYLDLVSLFVIGISFVKLIQDKRLLFRNAIIIYLVGLILNILSAYLNNHQPIRDTTLSLGYYYFILLYFWLGDNKIDRRFIENLIIILAILYVIFYQFQIDEFPRRIFRGTLFADRGTIRLRMQGASFNVLAYFILLNRYILKRNLLDILLAAVFLYMIISQGTRTFAATSILMSAILFVRLVKYDPMNYLLAFFVLILFIGIIQFETPSTIIQNMIETTQEQREEGEQYIRNVQRRYFLNVYPQNWSYYVFGGGFPGGRGSYAYYMLSIVGRYGFYWSDQGLLGFYLVLGGITLLGLLAWVLIAIFIKLPKDRLYLNMYFAFLLISSNIVMDEIFAPGIFGIQAIALYLIDDARKEMKRDRLKPNYDEK